jgi:hypothetical protein
MAAMVQLQEMKEEISGYPDFFFFFEKTVGEDSWFLK